MKAEERIADLKAHGYSPDDEGVPNPDVEWLVAELERARAVLEDLRTRCKGSSYPSIDRLTVIQYCDKGLGR